MPIDCKTKSKNTELLLFVIGSGNMNIDDIKQFTHFFEKYLHGIIPFKLFIDLRTVESTSSSIIQSLVKKMIKYEKYSKNVIATSVLINNSIIENLINILFSIRKPTTPTKITSSLTEACDFLNEYSIEQIPTN
jgi:anti-anti-sigma regulatory factor